MYTKINDLKHKFVMIGSPRPIKDTWEHLNSLLSTGQNISKMYKDILTGSELVNLSYLYR